MKENVFGIPLDGVVSAQEADEMAQREPTYYAVLRCADKPLHTIPAPLRGRMVIVAHEQCNASCWLDTKYAPRSITIRCLRHLPENQEWIGIRETIDEVRRLKGFPQ